PPASPDRRRKERKGGRGRGRGKGKVPSLSGGSRNDPERNRYGCFLPDLTGLATAPSARLPRGIWRRGPRKARPPGARGLPGSTIHHVVDAAGDAQGEAVDRLAGVELARQARMARHVAGEIEHVLLLLARRRQLGEIIGGDDDVAGRAGHLALACAL